MPLFVKMTVFIHSQISPGFLLFYQHSVKMWRFLTVVWICFQEAVMPQSENIWLKGNLDHFTKRIPVKHGNTMLKHVSSHLAYRCSGWIPEKIAWYIRDLYKDLSSTSTDQSVTYLPTNPISLQPEQPVAVQLVPVPICQWWQDLRLLWLVRGSNLLVMQAGRLAALGSTVFHSQKLTWPEISLPMSSEIGYLFQKTQKWYNTSKWVILFCLIHFLWLINNLHKLMEVINLRHL